jgi:hypothetical protein
MALDLALLTSLLLTYHIVLSTQAASHRKTCHLFSYIYSLFSQLAPISSYQT